MTRFGVGSGFLGRYVLDGVVGQGGACVVYRAYDTLLGRDVAIKMLGSALAGDGRATERIRREAVITDLMRHPAVPQIYNHGDAPLGDGTSVGYIVLELLRGTMLTHHLAGGPLPWREAVHIVATVAEAIAVAHRRGIVHRDLAPTNIMLTSDGVKILDFGLAVIGAPQRGYAPLLADRAAFAGPGEPADDVYALGVLLYQLLTGSSPYPTQEPVPPVAAAMMQRVAPTPVLTVRGLPPGLAEICRACMARRGEDRPDAAKVARELWALVAPISVPMSLALRDPAPAALPAGTPAEPPRRPVRLSRHAADRPGTGRHRRPRAARASAAQVSVPAGTGAAEERVSLTGRSRSLVAVRR